MESDQAAADAALGAAAVARGDRLVALAAARRAEAEEFEGMLASLLGAESSREQVRAGTRTRLALRMLTHPRASRRSGRPSTPTRRLGGRSCCR
jgi:hypothetical protein